MIKIKIGFCGYSIHTKGYYSSYKSGMDAYLFRLQMEGDCEVIAGDEFLFIERGDLIMIKPGEQYELRIKEGQKSGDLHLLCEGEWLDKWWNRSRKPTVTRIDLDSKVLFLWQQVIAEERRPDAEKNAELTDSLLRALFLSLERTMSEKAASKRPYVVTKMMRYIEERATTPLKIDDVAGHAGLSVSRAVHLFKEYVNKTMMEYAVEIRLSTAVNQMKYTTITLDTIAQNCGFGAYPYFHRVFKKHYGMAPGEYRNQ